MKVLYIYRNSNLGFSIETVFKPIEYEMQNYAEVDSIFLPEACYSFVGLWKNITAACKAAKSKKYDIIHITGAEYYLIPFLLSYHVVVTVHDLGFVLNRKFSIKRFFKYLFFVRPLSLATFLTFISRKTQDEVSSCIALHAGHYAVIPNAVGSGFSFFPKKFNSQKPVFLQVGTKPNKNLDRAIQALSGIPCHLRIVGKVSNSLHNLLERYRIDYSETSGLSDEEIICEYKNSDVVNFPSLYEGFGMPILEAQSVGRVVVTSNIEPMKSVAGNGAIFVNPNDIGSIRAAYLKCFDDSIRNQIIVYGYENVKKFNRRSIARNYYSVYQQCLKVGDGRE